MKHIKTYNIITEKQGAQNFFYYIPYTDEALVLLAIEKIDMAKELKQKMISTESQRTFGFLPRLCDPTSKNIGIFICIGYIASGYQYFICKNDADKEYGYKILSENLKYVYKGEIKLEDWEIAANKYNL